MLDADQLARWQHDGCLVLPGFKPPAAVAALRERSRAIVEAFEPGAEMAVFSSRDRRRLADKALLESADQVRCFFEEEAFDAEERLAVPKAQAINKIGHALHDRDPVFERFSREPPLAELARELGLVQPLLMQSMLIFKQPRIGGEVVWHQDASFLYTEPQSVIGFWFALEDATRDNGCLWVAPGATAGRCASATCGATTADSKCSRSTRRHGRKRRTPGPSRFRPAPWSCSTACCRTPVHRTARRNHGWPTRCTRWTAARVIRR
jgi:phytanoyl-CoA hydroxylase